MYIPIYAVIFIFHFICILNCIINIFISLYHLSLYIHTHTHRVKYTFFTPVVNGMTSICPFGDLWMHLKNLKQRLNLLDIKYITQAEGNNVGESGCKWMHYCSVSVLQELVKGHGLGAALTLQNRFSQPSVTSPLVTASPTVRQYEFLKGRGPWWTRLDLCVLWDVLSFKQYLVSQLPVIPGNGHNSTGSKFPLWDRVLNSIEKKTSQYHYLYLYTLFIRNSDLMVLKTVQEQFSSFGIR